MTQARALPERSHLFVPATNWRMIEKAAASLADAVVIDLEDAVAPSDKAAARVSVVKAMTELDFGAKVKMYRINGLDTPWAYRDLIEVLEKAADHVDRVMVPKVSRPEDVYFVDTLIRQILEQVSAGREVHVAVQIETAAGVLRARDIAAASRRVTAMVFGSGDFAASAGMPQTSIGEPDAHDARYPGHRWHFAMQSVVLAAKAMNLAALDGPFAGLEDEEGLRQAAQIARGLGFTGKQCIHPKQLKTVNETFSPTSVEVAWAKEVVAALQEAEAQGRGAIRVQGRMIDAANIRMARGILELDGHIQARGGR